MKTKWFREAIVGRRRVASYILDSFRINSKKKFLQRVSDMEQYIKTNPYSPKVDPLFSNDDKAYRSVFINGLSRMVYYVEDDVVNIVAFFDGRRDAEEEAKRVTE